MGCITKLLNSSHNFPPGGLGKMDEMGLDLVHNFGINRVYVELSEISFFSLLFILGADRCLQHF